MTKEQLIDYVMTTPNNPNLAVLNSLIDRHDEEILNNGSSGGGVFVVEIDWEERKAITPFNEIVEAWRRGDIIVHCERVIRDSSEEVIMYYLMSSQKNLVSDEYSYVSFYSLYQAHIGNIDMFWLYADGTIDYHSYDIEVSGGK